MHPSNKAQTIKTLFKNIKCLNINVQIELFENTIAYKNGFPNVIKLIYY